MEYYVNQILYDWFQLSVNQIFRRGLIVLVFSLIAMT